MGLLIRLVNEADQAVVVDVVLQLELPVLPMVLVGRLRRPQHENHIDGLPRHLATQFRIDTVKLLICRHAAISETEIQPTLGKVIEEREPTRHVGGMVLVETDRRGAQSNPLRLAQHAANEDLRHYDGLVFHRVVLADPELLEAQFLRPHDEFDVFLVSLRQRLGGVVIWHDEHAVFDGTAHFLRHRVNLPVLRGPC